MANDDTSFDTGDGARLVTSYHHRQQHAVSVNMEDLRDFRDSSTEEFWQFSLGGFLASGSFWLGVERFVTIPEWQEDILFWVCFFAFIAGSCIGFFGLRQLRRRRGRIDSIIKEAESKVNPKA